MSGHSKWAKIRHKKGLNDAKKGKIFSKYSQLIIVAAKDGGGDPDVNFSLRLLMDKAKSVGMPADNIQRAIDKGSGKSGESVTLENVMYEGKIASGVSFIVEGLTDNKNRTITDVRKVFSDNGGSLSEPGSVTWNFNRLGLVSLRPAQVVKSEKYGEADSLKFLDNEEVMLQLMDISGINDIKEYENNEGDVESEKGKYLDVYTDPKELAHVRDSINALGYPIVNSELIWQVIEPKTLSEEDLEKGRKLVEEMEELDDVQSIWSDVEELS